ncbi:hypothetical protein [Reinekea blandensis]|uniref:Transglycosylase SLT domain-containing protein n=1 Tax=Reinekea blandensis MED297 TaxID=314283 RepID=A4BCL5_9GAMM|nr:hypothetical protein [Reinekea blandensis]EAR10281.1 hypothetical protein MED297_13697 [Reinekea sp. MED297] [Reinekea blandensis MED297]
MLYSPETFHHQVVTPTLKELSLYHPELALCLTAIALSPQLPVSDGFGIYQISRQQHRRIWDEQLATNPDLASRVRGLASQHRFLRDPDQELILNPCYATAIAAHLLIPGSESVQDIEFPQLTQRWCHMNQTSELTVVQNIDQLRLQLFT